MPYAAAYAIAGAMQVVHAVVPSARLPFTSIYPVAKLGHDTSYDISRTRDELGYRPQQDVDRQMDAIVGWYRAVKAAGAVDSLGRR